MLELAIDLDQGTVRSLNEAAEREGVSPSTWAGEAIRERLDCKRREALLALYGAWQDDREPEEILRDIRDHSSQRERVALD
jgi:hypothetical protein